ncbi:hypothetical protein BDF20DRAFT_855633 [Mycotypha africana]|uniref:uncharacterized protein n=1 Tax=Mycotypha africana TaxID=64632 RepID=UPI0023002380|nr:uncharacterized protein BDF20DRAFT_855633 [Mycotypha africana]KAI8988427.1 hypothetical protein BDF20DRAFT_855633 [Mycotypha africana]
MKVWLSLALGAAVVVYAYYNIQQGLEPWAPKLMNMCFSPANTDTEGDLRVAYTGLSNTLDRYLCFLVNFYKQPLHDVVGAPLLRLMMAAFGTAYALMTFEASRRGFRKTLLMAFPLFGLLSHVFGIYAVFTLFWVPLDLYYQHGKTKIDYQIKAYEAYGILIALLLGYMVPSAIMTSPLIGEDTKAEQNFICLWFVLPLLLVPLVSVCQTLYKRGGSYVDRIKNREVKERLYIAEGKDAVERSYITLGIINMFLYFGSCWWITQQGIYLWDAIVLLLKAPGTLPADLTYGELGQLLTTRTLLIEYIVLAVGFILWATFNSGMLIGLAVALGTPFVGPAAAVSFYAYWRENHIQNLTSSNRAEAAALQQAINKAEEAMSKRQETVSKKSKKIN